MLGNTPLITEINTLYGDKIRVRSCGVLVVNDKILLLRHEGIGKLGYFWNVPGGSPGEGESLTQCVQREFLEEVNLKVTIGPFLYLNEYIKPPLHAVESYFRVEYSTENAELGTDPEMKGKQILSKLAWMNKQELQALPTASYPAFLVKLWNR